ncbi:hypothetical protein [Stenotrophomonas sp.]|uniref:hypothetical protein n=1 Tax=Stenotrophomonas sp. TaxID=69392 RepID=UPI00289E0BF1|nr:hypothetical protein [Stenotrophomonas sp.]
MIDRASPDELEAVVTEVEKALVARGYELTALSDLVLSITNTALEKMYWGTLARQFPGATGAAALMQLARAMYQGTWADVAKSLTTVGMTVFTLPPDMTSLRGIPLIDAMVASLPEVLRSQLEALHQWVQQSDDTLAPTLDLRQLGPLLAVVALLWYVQQRLPSPSGQLSGLGRFIADLPRNWQRLVSLDRIGAGLFAPVNTGRALIPLEDASSVRRKLTPEEKEWQIAQKWQADRQHLPDSVIKALSQEAPAAAKAPVMPSEAAAASGSAAPELSFESAAAPGAPVRGGAIAQPPVAPDDVATSAGGRAGTSWGSWATAVLTILGCFRQVAQTDSAMHAEEMVPMNAKEGLGVAAGVNNQETQVKVPLLELQGGVTAAARRFPNLRRPALATAIMTGLGGLGTGLWRLGAYYLSDTNSPPTPTPTDLAASAIDAVVQDPNGTWHAGLDELLGLQSQETPIVHHARFRRALFDADATTSGPPPADVPSGPAQLGLNRAQLEALQMDQPLQSQLQSMRLWAQVIAQEMGRLPDWEWIARLPESEQTLVALQWHTLRELKLQMAPLEGSAEALLGQALTATGWTGEWSDIEAQLPSQPVAGITVEDRLPLLQYCLVRRAASTPNAVPLPTFTRGGVPLDAPTQQRLQDFVNSDACSGLAADIKHRSEALRPLLNRALRARLIIDGIKAKSHHHENGDLQRHGAGLLVKFLQSQPDVERSVLTYADRLPNGRTVSITLPNYLVLRATGGDPRVLLYRADLSDVQFFSDDTSLRGFLDASRMRTGVVANKSAPNAILSADIVNAADPAQRADVAALVGQWTERYHLHLQRRNDPNGWNPNTSFQLDFTPVGPLNNAQKWAAALVSHSEGLARQAQARNELRWNPLGIAQVKADADYAQQLASVVKSLYVHAHPEVLRSFGGVLARHGIDVTASGLDPDQVKLTWNNVEMSLTAWASHGWQTDGLRPPALSNVQPDIPLDPGLPPNVRYEVPEWPSADELDAITITAYQPDAAGKPVKSETLTSALEDHDLRRALCGWLEAYASSNSLAEAYVRYLRGIPGSAAGAQLDKALGDRIRTGLAWMVAVAGQDGTLNPDSHRGLVHALSHLDPANGRASSLHVVTLDGVPIDGLWALHDGEEFRIFLSGENGSDDRVLDVAAFKTWLRESTSYTRFPKHVLFRYHKKLAQAFAKKDTRDGIPVGFRSTGGPAAAGRTLIEGRISDVEEISLTPLEQMAEALRIAGSVSAALVCSLATGGLGAGLCAVASLALVADGIVQAIDQFDRGDRDDAIASVGGSLHDAVDVLQTGAMTSLLFRLGKPALRTLREAAEGLRQFAAQLRAFDASGAVNQAFAVAPARLADAPMIRQALPGGATLYKQGGDDYIKVDDAFVQAGQQDGVLRLRDPDNPRDPGAPVEYRDGHWQRMDTPPRAGGTTPVPASTPDWVANIPEAGVLSPAARDMLEATFGVATLGARPGADLRDTVSDLTMKLRIQQIIDDPTTLGEPGDGSVLARAWSDSRRLGKGRAVQTYVYDDNNNQIFGPRIGAGPVGVLVPVDDSSAMPGVEALVDASNPDTLRNSLDLPADAGRAEIVNAARRELAAVIAANPAQSLRTWQNWRAARFDLPAAADNLAKRFRALTKAEAEEIVAGLDPDLKRQLEKWEFPHEVQTAVVDALARRSQRQQREAVVNGAFGTLGDVQQLVTQLQPMLEKRRFSVHGDGANGIALVIKPAEPGGAEAKLVFPGNGAASVTDVDGTLYDSWQQGVYQQLRESERNELRSPANLRQRVIKQMKEAPIASTCKIGKRVKRNVDGGCGPSTNLEAAEGVELSRTDVEQGERLGAQLDESHAKNDAAYFKLKQLEIEHKALLKKQIDNKRGKKGAEFSAQDAARLEELSDKNFKSLKGYEIMNVARYLVEGIHYKDSKVTLPAWFPLTGTALSTTPREWMEPGNYIPYDEPIRRVFIPVKDANGFPTIRGMYRTDYPAGADLRPAQGALSEPGEGSVKITFTADDLKVKLDGWSTSKPLNELTDAEIRSVESRHMSPALKKYMGDARLLPTNAKALVPGDYRMYQILSCSESKILGGVFKALGEAEPALVPLLWGSSGARIDGLTGKLFIYSDMDPCNISCDPRLTEVLEQLPDMNIRVFYRFKDPLARKAWFTEGKIGRVIEKNRADWERLYDSRSNPVPGDDFETWMKAKAVEEMKKPDVLSWLEHDLLERPLEMPPARVWEPIGGL